MQDEIEFDNFYVGTSLTDAFGTASVAWKNKFEKEDEVYATQEKERFAQHFGSGIIGTVVYHYEQVLGLFVSVALISL